MDVDWRLRVIHRTFSRSGPVSDTPRVRPPGAQGPADRSSAPAHRSALTADPVVAGLRCAPQPQRLQRRHPTVVMPGAVTQHGALGNLHPRPAAPHPGLFQQQAALTQAIVFFPEHLLDRVLPGQGERLQRQRRPDAAGHAQTQRDHATASRTRWRQRCQPITSAPRTKPSSSLIGKARTRLAPRRTPPGAPTRPAAPAGSRWKPCPTGRWPAPPCR